MMVNETFFPIMKRLGNRKVLIWSSVSTAAKFTAVQSFSSWGKVGLKGLFHADDLCCTEAQYELNMAYFKL